MSRESIVFVLGFVFILLPFLGILQTYKNYLTIALGVLLVFVGYSLRRSRYLRQLENGDGERSNDSYVERFQPRLDYPDAPLHIRREYHE